jgi:hypothetical protein
VRGADQAGVRPRLGVERVLTRWAVTVYRMPDREVLAEDYFDQWHLAKARAEDFGHLLKSRVA